MTFVSMIEPKNFKEAIIDDQWIVDMQEELNQQERNQCSHRRVVAWRGLSIFIYCKWDLVFEFVVVQICYDE